MQGESFQDEIDKSSQAAEAAALYELRAARSAMTSSRGGDAEWISQVSAESEGGKARETSEGVEVVANAFAETVEREAKLNDMMGELAKLQGEIAIFERDLGGAKTPIEAKVIGSLLRETKAKHDALREEARAMVAQQ